MTTPSKLRRLIDRLHDQTNTGSVTWTPGSREDTFIWSGTSASVILSTRDFDGQAPFELAVMDSDGRTVEQATFGGLEGIEDLERVRALYKSARSSALNIDETIDGLLSDLE